MKISEALLPEFDHLRLNGIPVPAIYGPSADEPWA